MFPYFDSLLPPDLRPARDQFVDHGEVMTVFRLSQVQLLWSCVNLWRLSHAAFAALSHDVLSTLSSSLFYLQVGSFSFFEASDPLGY